MILYFRNTKMSCSQISKLMNKLCDTAGIDARGVSKNPIDAGDIAEIGQDTNKQEATRFLVVR